MKSNKKWKSSLKFYKNELQTNKVFQIKDLNKKIKRLTDRLLKQEKKNRQLEPEKEEIKKKLNCNPFADSIQYKMKLNQLASLKKKLSRRERKIEALENVVKIKNKTIKNLKSMVNDLELMYDNAISM